MTANFTRGVLTCSSWHGLEEIGVMNTAAEMIDHGERLNVLPTRVCTEALLTASGLKCHKEAIVATYRDNSRECVGVVGNRYRPTTPEEVRAIINAAVDAGAKPTGVFLLRSGRLIVCTFEVGESNGLKTQLVMVDSFDGSYQFTIGFTSIRVVCCNTLAAAMAQDGEEMARFRHTSSLSDKIAALVASIPDVIKGGSKIRDLYHAAESLKLSRSGAEKVFDLLFPEPGVSVNVVFNKDTKQNEIQTVKAEKITPNASTRATNARAAGRIAATLDVNREGNSLATLWNAATYLVDRTEEQTSRKVRGGTMLDSMLLGTRGERVQEIMTIIEVVMRDGSIRAVPAPEAVAMGCDPSTIAKSLIDEMTVTPEA